MRWASLGEVSWKRGCLICIRGRGRGSGFPYGRVLQSVLTPLPILYPVVVLAPAKPRKLEKRAGVKVPWMLGEDQAELRGERCRHMNLAINQPTSLQGTQLCA